MPFARTAAERSASGDRRLSIEERYDGRDDYLGRARAAAGDLVEAGWLLDGDVETVVASAARCWDLFAASPAVQQSSRP